MDSNKRVSMLADFNTLALLLIPVGIAINVVGGSIAKALQLPLFLDAIGTLMVGIIAGPWVGAATGLIHNVVLGLIMNPVMIPYAIVNMAFGLVAGFLAQAGWFEKPVRVFFAGLIIVAVAVIISAPINVFLFGGAAHGAAGLLTGYLIAIGTGIWRAVFTVEILRELADKLISVYAAFGIYKALPPSFLSKFPSREK